MRKLSSWFLVALLALTHVGSAAHYALVRHEVAADGGVVHVAKAAGSAARAPNRIAHDSAVTQLPSTGCSVSALQRQAFEMPPPAHTVSTLGTFTNPLPRFCLRVADSSDAYRFAPKNGPPA